jgi:hypothetical protein
LKLAGRILGAGMLMPIFSAELPDRMPILRHFAECTGQCNALVFEARRYIGVWDR